VTWLPNAYPRAHYYLGYLAVKRGRNLDAVRWLDAGQALEPRSAHFRLEKAQALGGLQRRKEALALFDEVLAMGDEVPAPLRAVAMRGRGFQLIEFGRLEEAESIFKESLRLDPENRVALNELKYIREVREGRAHGGIELVETKGPAPATTCDLCAGPLGEAWDVEKRGGRVLHVCRKCAT
jgi:tetratricopeptide (TPR) repeat protein